MTDRTVTTLKAIRNGARSGPALAQALEISVKDAFAELGALLEAGLIKSMPHQSRYAAPETRAFQLTPAGDALLSR